MIRTWLAAAGLSAALAFPGAAQDFDIQTMNEAEREAFGDAVRQYLMENPALLREWIVALQDHEAQQEANRDLTLVADNAEALFEDDRSWAGGNLEGDVTLVEFLDYRCGFCKRAHPVVLDLVSSDGNIRKIIKEFPILGEESTLASRFAISVLQVEGDDAYKVISDRLMEHRGAFTTDSLTRIAESEDLDTDAVLARMDAPEVTEVIEANYALAQAMSISGTPTFVLGDQLIRGFLPLEDMQSVVEMIRAE